MLSKCPGLGHRREAEGTAPPCDQGLFFLSFPLFCREEFFSPTVFVGLWLWGSDSRQKQ